MLKTPNKTFVLLLAALVSGCASSSSVECEIGGAEWPDCAPDGPKPATEVQPIDEAQVDLNSEID